MPKSKEESLGVTGNLEGKRDYLTHSCSFVLQRKANGRTVQSERVHDVVRLRSMDLPNVE
jgi:hypothetical protein